MAYKFLFPILILTVVFLSGCSGGHVVKLHDLEAQVTLPQEPKLKTAKLPVKLFTGDPAQTAPPAVRTVRAGDKPPKPLWEETPFIAELTDYQVSVDPRYHWGGAVVEFDAEAWENLGDERLSFVRTHFIPPGHYGLLDETTADENGLKTLRAKGKQARGESQIELKLVEKKPRIYCVRFEANLDRYPQERAQKILQSLQVAP